MSKFRIEYLPKLGADIKMVNQGFDTIDSAERYARLNLNMAPYASISMGERRVKDLWRKVECHGCVGLWRDGKLKLTAVPWFTGTKEMAEHLLEKHGEYGMTVPESQEIAEEAFAVRPLIDNSKDYSVDDRGKVRIRGRN